jgi:hypothetical protein
MTLQVRSVARGYPAGMRKALTALIAVGLAACSAVGDKIGDSLPAAVGGLPSDVPARSATQPDFIPVGDTPPRRDLKPLTEDERKKLEADLVTLRDRQEGKMSHSQEKRASGAANARATDQATNQ